MELKQSDNRINCHICNQPVRFLNIMAEQLARRKNITCRDCRRGGRQWTKETYQAYLQSAHWKQTRKKALKRAQYKCQLCAHSHFLQVHHNDYDRLGGELPTDLVVLCEDCHGHYHEIF